MEKEVSNVMEIATTLVALAALIGIVWLTVFIGLGMKNDALESANRLTVDVQQGVLSDMVGQENDIPAATAYALLRSYGAYVPECTCNIVGCSKNGVKLDLAQSTPCILSHMSGKLSLQIEKNNDWYSIIIHKTNCTWYYGTCTCSNP